MYRPLPARFRSASREPLRPLHWNRAWLFVPLLSLVAFGALLPAAAQVITVDNNGNVVASSDKSEGYVDRRFRQVEPTKVPLPSAEMDSRTRLQLIRVLQAEQGFAMRPIPKGHKGLTLEANGKLDPAGERYLSMVTAEGLCAKPGDRLVITDVKVERSKIVLTLNGGPDFKHRFLRHIQIGAGPMMNPVIQDNEQTPMGARVTLKFSGRVPALTGSQVKDLLSPLISFNVKTPIEAFTDTLPPMLKQAILSHHVLVGMSTDMVLFAKGRPAQKVRELEGQMPIEIWIYGKPPHDVDFIRINGNRVIRVEIAKVGQPLQIFTENVVEGMMRTDGKPLIAGDALGNKHTVEMGDVQRNPDTQAPAPPPTLRNPGEKLPAADPRAERVGVMRPVQFPQQKPDDDSAAARNVPAAAAKPAAPADSSTNPDSSAKKKPADASQTAPSNSPSDSTAQPQ